MNSAKNNKELFKAYLVENGMSLNTVNNYASALNSKVTELVRGFFNIDMGSIFGVTDVRLLTYWLKVLLNTKEFEAINQEWNGSPYAAYKKYIEYVKSLPKK